MPIVFLFLPIIILEVLIHYCKLLVFYNAHFDIIMLALN